MTKGIWIREVTIAHYGLLLSDTVLQFAPRVNIVLGRNSTGRTTLLRLLKGIVNPDLAEVTEPEKEFSGTFVWQGAKRVGTNTGLAGGGVREWAKVCGGSESEWVPAILDGFGDGRHYFGPEMELAALESSGRQVFITTQNPWVIDQLDPYDLESSVILCSWEQAPGMGRWLSWRNLTKEEAIEIWQEREERARDMSAILRTKGLW